MINIKQIPAIQTYPVRHPVLRPGKPIETCAFAGDDLETTIHFGAFINDEIAGCISVFYAGNEVFNLDKQYQLRGMAVLEQYQKKGLGELLINKAEEFIKNKQGKLIWFNARENAVNFYKKMGYKITNQPFTIPDVGIHYIISKHL